MPNIQSASKRVRKSEKQRYHNRYYHRTARNAIKRLRNTTDKSEAQKMLVDITGQLDKLAKRKIIHKNKADNLKSKLARHVNQL